MIVRKLSERDEIIVIVTISLLIIVVKSVKVNDMEHPPLFTFHDAFELQCMKETPLKNLFA